MTETSATSSGNYVITEHGLDTITTIETMDTLNGSYTQTETGTDGYTLTEAGTLASGAYSETLTGNDTISQWEAGNTIQGTYTRTLSGGGNYSLSETGGTMTLGSGSNSYSLTESANNLTGDFSITETGKDRYGFLQQFDNIADTSGVNTPGHMNYNPFGDAFVDDASDDCPIKVSGVKDPEEMKNGQIAQYQVKFTPKKDGDVVVQMVMVTGSVDFLDKDKKVIYTQSVIVYYYEAFTAGKGVDIVDTVGTPDWMAQLDNNLAKTISDPDMRDKVKRNAKYCSGALNVILQASAIKGFNPKDKKNGFVDATEPTPKDQNQLWDNAPQTLPRRWIPTEPDPNKESWQPENWGTLVKAKRSIEITWDENGKTKAKIGLDYGK